MGKPARGNAIQFGIRTERSYNVPGPLGGAFEWIRTRLPVTLGLTRTEEASGQVNRSGFTEAGIPGFITGEGQILPIPLTAGLSLPRLQSILGSNVANGTLVKTELEAGPPPIFQYDFEPDPDGLDLSEEILVGFPPVENLLLRGIKWSAMAIGVTGPGEIPVTLTGFASHESRLGQAEAQVGNTGTYVLGPHVRGPLKDRAAGDVWIRKTGSAPLKFKMIQSVAAPADPADWDAADEYVVSIDPETLEGHWQIGLGATALDVGIFTSENRDPFEIIWPGDAAAHADADDGDTWRCRVDWPLPAATYLATAGRRYTMAHWRSFQRDVGAPAWVETPFQQMTLTPSWPVTPDQGGGTRYYIGLDRDQLLAPTIALQRRYLTTAFKDRQERHERFEARQLWEGQQLGTGAHRETVEVVLPSLGLRTRSTDAPVGAITESIEGTAETDGAGSAPMTVKVITDRDWTPAA